MNGIWTSLIGLFGVVAGVALNEVIRRSRRVETFTPKIFEKRLAKYEELMALLQAGYEVASDVMENPEHSVEDRHDLISGAVLSMARFTDQEELYIDAELAAHCVAVFMGAEDVMSIEDGVERETAKQHIRSRVTPRKCATRRRGDMLDRRRMRHMAHPRVFLA